MAAGLPVLASDLPAIREVAGDATVLVPPGDVDALARGLQRIVGDHHLEERLRRRGPERAAGFTWEATAETTVCAYRAALGRSREEPAPPCGDLGACPIPWQGPLCSRLPRPDKSDDD